MHISLRYVSLFGQEPPSKLLQSLKIHYYIQNLDSLEQLSDGQAVNTTADLRALAHGASQSEVSVELLPRHDQGAPKYLEKRHSPKSKILAILGVTVASPW